MSVISLLDVKILNNPAPFNAAYQFEITFESLENLQSDLEWKLTYVGSAQSSEHDQELDSIMVGPIPPGINKFVFEADAPNTSSIPSSEVLGVTVILLTCAYDGREFVRVGYYVNNEYADEALAENPPAKPVIEKIRRNILAEKPRVTRFAIKWDSEATAPPEFPPDQPEADAAPDDEAAYGAEELAEMEAAGEAGPAAGAEAEAAVAPVAADGDAEMGGVEPAKDDAPAAEEAVAADDEDEGAGSEDIEADSSEDDEDDEDDNEDMDGDEDMEMGDDAALADAHKAAPAGEGKPATSPEKQRPADVMVH